MDTLLHDTIFHDAERDAVFARQGYLVLDILNPAQTLQELTNLYEQVADRYTTGFSATLLQADPAHREATHHAVVQLLAPTIRHYFRAYRQLCGGFAVKQADGARSAMPLHQDISFHRPGGRPGLNFWLPLVPTDDINGNLQVVPGSQRHHPHERAPGTPFPFPDREAELRRQYLLPVPTRYGQAIVTDLALFHASPPNASSAVRPVASNVLLPQEAPAYYYHRLTNTAPVLLEAYPVPDAFYFSHRLGTRPAGLVATETVPEAVPDANFSFLTYG